MHFSRVFSNVAFLSLLCAAAAALPPDPQKLMVLGDGCRSMFSFPLGGGMCFTLPSTVGEWAGVFRSDGTAAGSARIVFPGKEGNYAEMMASDGNRAYLAVSGGSSPNEGGWTLWRLDAGTAVPQYVSDIVWAANSNSRYSRTALIHNGILYFGTGNGELWRSDGTSGGTQLLAAFAGHPQPYGGPGFMTRYSPGALIPLGNRVLFHAYDLTFGYTLWTTDGTSMGTVPVTDLAGPQPELPGTPSSSLAGLIHYGWAAEGVAGMYVFYGFHSSPNDSFVNDLGSECFIARENGDSVELEKVAVLPETPLERIGDTAYGLRISPDTVVFRLDISTKQLSAHSLDLWGQPYPLFGYVSFQGKLFCSVVTSGDSGCEPHFWDPADDTLHLLKDIMPGIGQSFYEISDPRLNPPWAKSGGFLYFKANSMEAVEGAGLAQDSALWRTDGTDEGTVRVANFDGISEGNMFESTVYANGGRLFFLQKDYRPEVPAEELGKWALWVIDHSVGGTAPRAVIYGAGSRVAEGSTVTLRAGGDGLLGHLSCEWFFNGQSLGVYAATLILTDVTAFNAGAYTVRIYDDSKGVHESEPFVLEVLAEGALPVGAGAGLAVLLAAAGALALRRRRMGTQG